MSAEIKKRTLCPYCGGDEQDTEIVDWLEKNAHRLLVTRHKFGALKFTWGTRDDTGLYTFHPERYESLRPAVTAAIEFDRKQQDEKNAKPVC